MASDGEHPTFYVAVERKTQRHPNVGRGSNMGFAFSDGKHGYDQKLPPLRKGQTYLFLIHAPSHPFYISTDGDRGGEGIHDAFPISGNTGVTDGELQFTVPEDGKQLYYCCANHPFMGGPIVTTYESKASVRLHWTNPRYNTAHRPDDDDSGGGDDREDGGGGGRNRMAGGTPTRAITLLRRQLQIDIQTLTRQIQAVQSEVNDAGATFNRNMRDVRKDVEKNGVQLHQDQLGILGTLERVAEQLVQRIEGVSRDQAVIARQLQGEIEELKLMVTRLQTMQIKREESDARLSTMKSQREQSEKRLEELNKRLDRMSRISRLESAPPSRIAPLRQEQAPSNPSASDNPPT